MKNSCKVCSRKKRPERFPEKCASSVRATWRRSVGALSLGVVMLDASGCTALGAKPWDHDLLAEHAMQVGAYPLEAGMDDHIYFSKEASSGGRSFAGGGCGCN